MTAKIDEPAATALWKSLAFTPSIKQATFVADGSVRAVVGGSDVDAEPKPKARRRWYRCRRAISAVDLGDVARLCVSPSGDLAAVVVARAGEAGKKTMALEIWASDGALPGRVRASDAKGVALSAIYTDAQFGDLCWSADESMVAFVAEEAKSADGQHDYEEDMGEQLEGKVLPRLYTVAVSRTRGVVGDPVLVPGSGQTSCCVGQPQLTVGADGAPRCVFTGWEVGARAPRRHLLPGAPGCALRASSRATRGATRGASPRRFAVAHSPRVSPSGARAIFLAHSVLPTTHMACQALLLVDLAADLRKGLMRTARHAASSSTKCAPLWPA